MLISDTNNNISHLSRLNKDIFQKLNAREKAYWIIRDKILYMDIKPGEPVSDKILAEQLEMSRTPVREALILLSAYNMVVMKPQIGTFVAPIDSEWVSMEQFSRLTMEKEIIRQACSSDTDALYQAYEKNLELFTSHEQRSDSDRIRMLHELDNDFHSLAFAAVGKINSYFHMRSYMQHIERLRILTLRLNTDDTIPDDHRMIAEAVRDRDVQKALTHLEEHLSIFKSSVATAKAKYPEYFVLG